MRRPADSDPTDFETRLRALPPVNALRAALNERFPATLAWGADEATIVVRAALADARARLQKGVGGEVSGDPPTVETLASAAFALGTGRARSSIRPVVNATGVVLHTNLGRARLAETASRAAFDAASSHVSLEFDLETGGRGDRQLGIARLFRELTGAQDCLVVNNNAAATYLAVQAIATGKEVVLSRGQMVEIGGHFRLPDVIESAGARLREVGTTNRTRISDYERALSPETAMLLRCHPSNYKIIGFTEEASLSELVALGKKHGVCVGDDIGSGALIDLSSFGLSGEPRVSDSLDAGADLVWFSGDKLLGGPQCGVLLGHSETIARLKRHPLARALRPDKMTLAALEATLKLYRNGRALEDIPTLRAIARTKESVRDACERVAARLRATPNFPRALEVIECDSEIGGGSLPGRTLKSFAVAVTPAAGESCDSLSRKLRAAPTPVIARVERSRVLLDLRCVDETEEIALADAFDAIRAEP